MMTSIVLTHMVCFGLGAATWWLLSPSLHQLRRFNQHRRCVKVRLNAERWQLEAMYLGQVVQRMTDVAKTQASLAETKRKVTEQYADILEMADAQERQRIERFRKT